jgi:hypothetical protein
MKNLVLFCLLFLSVSCSTYKANPLILEKNIGWMHGNCLAIKNGEINTPTDITLIRFDEENVIEKATVVTKTNKQEGCFPLFDDRKKINTANGYSFYLVNSTTPVDLAIGVINGENLNASSFSYCATAEGLKYFYKDSSTVFWEGYYYLGYDSQITCGSHI